MNLKAPLAITRRHSMNKRGVAFAFLAGHFYLVSAQTPTKKDASSPPPTIDGIIKSGEWSGARREILKGGGEVLLLNTGNDLYIAVIGVKAGFPTIYLGNSERVEVLHASAALGSASYTRKGSQWIRDKSFDWRVRDNAIPSPSKSAERESFFAEYRWLSNPSRLGSPTREFRIALSPERRFLSIVFLSTDTMDLAYWPTSINDSCRDLDLLRGNASEFLQFDPIQWHKVE